MHRVVLKKKSLTIAFQVDLFTWLPYWYSRKR